MFQAIGTKAVTVVVLQFMNPLCLQRPASEWFESPWRRPSTSHTGGVEESNTITLIIIYKSTIYTYIFIKKHVSHLIWILIVVVTDSSITHVLLCWWQRPLINKVLTCCSGFSNPEGEVMEWCSGMFLHKTALGEKVMEQREWLTTDGNVEMIRWW